MKVLKIDCEYYQYPNEFDSLPDFIQYLNENCTKFISLVHFLDENCVHPYYIQEDIEKVCLNIGQMDSVSEEEITVLPRKEYDERLVKIIESKCVGCAKFEDDDEEIRMEGFRTNISLDGECTMYQKAE